MAFDDHLVGSDSFDSQGATRDLIQDIDHDPLPPSVGASAQALTTRLARKLNQKPLNVDYGEKKPKEPKQEELDFSDQAVPADQAGATTPASTGAPGDNSELDFSDQATYANPEDAPKKPDDTNLGLTGNVWAGIKGIPHGAIESGAGALQAGAIAAGRPSMSTATQTAAAGIDPSTQWPLPGQTTDPEAPSVPVQGAKERLTSAAQAVKGAAQTVAPMTDAEKASFGGQFGLGIGGVAPYVAVGAVNPVAGIMAGMAGMSTQSYANAYDAAIQKGASDEDAAQAAGYNGIVGAALGGLPVGAILAPVKNYFPAATGVVAGILNKYLSSPAARKTLASGLTFTGVVELQEKIGDEIAQHMYEPGYRAKLTTQRDQLQAQIDQVKASPQTGQTIAWSRQAQESLKSLDDAIKQSKDGYSPDFKRMLASFLTGGALGYAHAKLEGKPKPLGLPGPDTGKPDTPPPDETTPPDLPPNAKPPDFRFTSPGRRDTFEKVVNSYGDGHDVKNMTDAELWNVVAARDQEHMGSRPAGSTAPEPEPAKPAEEAPPGAREDGKDYATQPYQPTHEQYAALKDQGWADEDIGMMSEGQAARAVLDAKDEGVDLKKAMARHPLPQQPAPEKGAAAPEEKPENFADIGKMGSAMAEGLHNRLWDKVQKGDTTELGQTDPMLQAAKMVRARGGLQSRDAYLAFAQDYGNIGERKGPEFQKQMRALVEKHSPEPASSGPVKADEAGQRPLTEAAGQAAPKGSPVTGPEATIPKPAESSTPTEQKPVETEVTNAHHAAIEKALGPDAPHVQVADAHRAAEILAEHPDMPPEIAFQHAVIANMAHQGYFTPEELEEIYGPNTHQILEAGGTGAHEGDRQVAAEGAKPQETGGKHPQEAGVAGGGGEDGGRRGKPTTAGPAEPAADDTTGGERHPAGEAGGAGKPAPEAAKPTDAADTADHADHADQIDKKHSDAIETAIDKIEHAVEAKARIEDVLKAGKAAREVLAGVPAEVKARDPEYWKQFSGVITKMMKPGYVTGKQSAETATAERLEELKKQLIVVSSGMSRIKDFKAGTFAWGQIPNRGIGVDVGELSKAGVDELAKAAVDREVQLFVDSGAFSTFRRNLRNQSKADKEAMDLFGSKKPSEFASLDFDAILKKYDDLLEAIEKHNAVEGHVPPPMLVMPDIVGDQAASLGLVEKYKQHIATEAKFDVALPIVPIQKGKLSLEQAYNKVVETLGTDRFVVGIPSNEKAVSNDELTTFIARVQPKRIHFLGAASAKNLDPKLNILAAADYDIEHLSADANILRSALYGKYSGDRATAIADKLWEKAPEDEKQKITDAGEKIGGARKDTWSGRGLKYEDLEDMTGAERDKNLTKHNIWKKPDYVQAVADGVDPTAAALVKRIYDRLPVKPSSDFVKEDTARYFIEALNAVHDAVAKVKTVDDVKALSGVVEKAVEWKKLNLLYPKNSRYNPLDLTGDDIRAAKKAVEAGFPEMAAWATRFNIEKRMKVESYTETGPDGREWSGQRKVEGQYTYTVYRKNGGRIGDPHDTREAAEAAAKAAYEKLGEDAKQGPQEPKRPHLDNVYRDGPDYRAGRDVTGEDFVKDFGFHGVEFGNWLAGDERQKVVNLGYDALHDLARMLGIDPKALSLNGYLSVGFGSRGRGGKAAAHYEPDRRVINMTKISGAGSLAHEWAHALDHYLGEIHSAAPYASAVKSVSGWDNTPREGDYASYDYKGRNRNLPQKLQVAVNRLMHDMFSTWEDDTRATGRLQTELASAKSGQQSWVDHLAKLRRINKKAGQKEAQTQVDVWGRKIERLERQLAEGVHRKAVPSDYLKEATKLSGKTGDYWRRPAEMWARSLESFVFDKLAKEGHESQYLVQGVEPGRFGNGWKGNPYPTGEERTTQAADWERVLRALTAVEGKHGPATMLKGGEGLPEPVEEVTKVAKPVPQPALTDEIKAVDEASHNTLPDAFADHFGAGGGFAGILEARKFAKDKFGVTDPKAVEEALELAVVKTARWYAEQNFTPGKVYAELVHLYSRQPKLGTRTSTSIREQAYSTPVPLAYVAAKLAHIDGTTPVYEPTAGNGALLMTADPQKAVVNEINPERAANLRSQGFTVFEMDAATSLPRDQIEEKGIDRVIANPPFGSVKDDKGETTIYKLSGVADGLNYQTGEVDHAIALHALDAMKDNGRAVLILGSVNPKISTPEGRADAYNGKAKREFYKALHDQYNVTDLFTVSGDLYERQGAGWPVDVVVINGRRRSDRPLPAVVPPRIYSDWASLGGLLDGQPGTGDLQQAGGATTGAPAGRPELEAQRPGDRGPTGLREPGLGQPGGIRPEPEPPSTEIGVGGPETGDVTEGSGEVGRPGGTGEQPAPLSDAEIDDFLNDLINGPEAAAPAAPTGGLTEAAIEGWAETGGLPGSRNARAEQYVELRDKSSPTDKDIARRDKLRDELAAEAAPAPAPTGGARTRGPRAKPTTPDTRTTPEVARSAATNLSEGGEAAIKGLTELFGGGKTFGAGPAFDDETYAKAKPFFKEAIKDFGGFGTDIRELMRRLVDHLRNVVKWGTEALNKAARYISQFVKDVQSGEIKLDEGEPRVEPIKPQAIETENQIAYKPQSKTAGLDTLAPVNMAKPMRDSLQALEDKVGPVDKFVSKELGYKPDELGKYFGAEQVDALGLAIDNIKNGTGFIIGDQTGIGKGRVNAAIIRWAIKNNRVPVFVTEKPNLYKDMYRDLQETGIEGFLKEPPRILATNSGLDLALDDTKGGPRIKTGEVKDHNAHLGKMITEMPNHYDMVFTTYNQMQTLKGGETDRRTFLSQLADRPGGIVMILDESHNAGGQVGGRVDPDAPPSRAQFARDLVQKANGVFYSSATYAKRPEVMDLYAATNMKMAVDNINDLAPAILHGGVPMQQAVASMLARDGQYMRRERSFAGINYNTPVIPVDRDTYNEMSRSLKEIQDLSKYTKGAASRMTRAMRAEGETIGGDASVGEGGASSTNFTSVMHNVVNQMLLAFKADHAADMAIAAIKRGEKPVLTVANTMEAFLQDYANEMGVVPGGDMSGNFGHVLKKYLDRTRTVLIKKPFAVKGEKPTRHYLTDEELGPEGLATYNKALATIQGMDLSGLPLSPIDYIKSKIEKAGYAIGEITGRGLMVDYTGKKAVLAKRPGTDKTPAGKSKTISAFNTRPGKGGTHAMIINQSGSTGLSLHSNSKFDDKSKRSMYIVQPEANIDTHMQLLGRINRTGQVVLPEYHQLVLDAPAEKRPAAVLSKKMASLNANTTASRSSAVTAKDVPDFINQYGDAIAASWVRDNPEEHHMMGAPVSLSEEGVPQALDAMRKLTGRIPLRDLERQEEIYQQLEGEYQSLISQLEAAGENALEAKSVDLKAKLLQRLQVQGERNNSGSAFAAPVVMQKVSVARIGKPFKPAEVIGRVEEALTGARQAEIPMAGLADKLQDFNNHYSILGKRAAAVEQEERTEALKRFSAYSRPILDEIEKPEDQVKEQTRLNTIKDRWTTVHQMVPIGRRVVLKTDTSNLTGIVIDVRQQGAPKNPLALGSWKVRFAIADASRQIELPFGRLFPEGQSNPDSQLDVEVAPMSDWYEPYEGTLDKFEHLQSEAREERWIAGGNILSAYNWLGNRGSILNFTSDTGSVHQGIMTARGFDPTAHATAHGQVERDPHKIRELLDASLKDLTSKDGQVFIKKESRYGRSYIVSTTRPKSTGGQYYLNKDLTRLLGDFQSRGGHMRAFANESNIEPVIAQLIKLGAEFKTPASVPKGEEPGEGVTLATISTPEGENFTPEERAEIEAAVRAAVKRSIGAAVRVEFNENIPLTEESAQAWGAGGERSGAPVAGKYTLKNGNGLIQLSLLTEHLESNLAHEIYHAIEFQLQTRQERRLMKAETPRIRRSVRPYVEKKYGLTGEAFDAIKDDEIRAIGFEKFAMDGATGVHVGVKRWYQKLWDVLRKIKNALLGRGYAQYEDVYGKAATGGYRERGNEYRPDVERASIGPAGRRGPPPMPETVEEQLRARNMTQLANVAKRTGLGKLNPVEVRTKIQDRMIRLRNLEQNLGNTDTALSVYQAEALNHGRTGERLEALENRSFTPLVKEMRARDVSLGELNAYLYGMHAFERNAYIDTINPAMKGEGSGMSDSDAQDILNRIGPNRMPDFEHLAQMVYNINKETRGNLVAYGLISQETANQWERQYQNYVPLRGFEEASENDPGTVKAGLGLDQRAQVSKPAMGRASLAQGPLQWVMMQAESAIVRGEKNRVGNTMLRLLQQNPDPDRWGIDRPLLKRGFDKNGMVTHFADFRVHNDPDAFVTRVGGKPVVMRFHGRDGANIARALKNMGASNMNTVMRAALNLTTLMAKTNTLYSPEFLISNFERDIGEAFINMGEQNKLEFVKRFAKHVLPAMKGIFQSLTDPSGQGGGAYGAAFREFDKAGGRIRFFGLKDTDEVEKNINRIMRRMDGGTFNNLASAAHATHNAFEIVNGAVENATRLAAYMAARDTGMNVPDAAMLGRNMTVDFNRKGEWGSAISALWMFGGAQVQGVARTGRALQHKRVRQLAYALAAMGALGALYNLLAGGNDDDGQPYYSKIPPWVRDKNLIIMYPKGMGHDGLYIKAAQLPFSFSPFHVLGDRAMAVVMGKDKVSDALHAFLSSVGDAFNPLGNEANTLMQLVPSLARPWAHIQFNKNWTDRPIYPDQSYNKEAPDSSKAFRNTSEFSKTVASKLNEWTGGSKYQSGWADVHPGTLDHIIETVSGGAGRFASGLYHAGAAALNGEFDPTKVPFLRHMVGDAKDPQSENAAYYAAREQAKTEAGANLKAARKDLALPDNAAAQAYIDAHPDAAPAQKIFDRADKQAKFVRRDLDEAIAEKRPKAEIAALQEQIRQIQMMARKEYREMKQPTPP